MKIIRAADIKPTEPPRSAWLEYESEKRRVQTAGLTGREYEQAVKRLCTRLGL